MSNSRAVTPSATHEVFCKQTGGGGAERRGYTEKRHGSVSEWRVETRSSLFNQVITLHSLAARRCRDQPAGNKHTDPINKYQHTDPNEAERRLTGGAARGRGGGGGEAPYRLMQSSPMFSSPLAGKRRSGPSSPLASPDAEGAVAATSVMNHH